MEPDRGHPQLGRGESGCLQQMGWGCLRSPRNEGAVPRPAQPTNQVLGRTFESVSIPSSVARLRPTSPTALPDVSGLRRAKRSWAAWKPTAWKTGGSATATPSVAAGSAELDRRLSTTLRPYGHLNCCDFWFNARADCGPIPARGCGPYTHLRCDWSRVQRRVDWGSG